MTLGQKIKRIRTFRNMTQQELGEAIGLDAKGAANRIAQYEINYRVPKKEMLLDMARALNVNPINFVCEVSGSAEDIMQTLFWLDEDNRGAINLFPLICNNNLNTSTGTPYATYNESFDWPAHEPIGMWFDYCSVDDFMREWMLLKQELKHGKITNDEYFEWKLNWPATCNDCGKLEPKKKWRKKNNER